MPHPGLTCLVVWLLTPAAELVAPSIPELVVMLLICGTDACATSAIAMLQQAIPELLAMLPETTVADALPRSAEESYKQVDRQLLDQLLQQMRQDTDVCASCDCLVEFL